MRKPRDFDAELQALTDKAKAIKMRKQAQLGELVAATGADNLNMETLAGALLDAATTTDTGKKEAWRKSGASFFHSDGARARKGARGGAGGASTDGAGAEPPTGKTGTA